MKRLTTNTPQDNTRSALNLFYIKDGETWVRGGGQAPDYLDVRLYDYIRDVVETLKADIDAGLSDDDLGECLYELLIDGNSTMEGVTATLYMAAWAFSSLRAKLSAYEDTGLEPEEIGSIQRAFALACRILSDSACPADAGAELDWPECNGEMDRCGDDGMWVCWQKHLLERVKTERVCRVCGCAQYNACPGGCFWVEEDLCSACAEAEAALREETDHA